MNIVVLVINKHLYKAGSDTSQIELDDCLFMFVLFFCNNLSNSSLPGLGQGVGSGQLFAISVVEVELGCRAGRLGSPSSGGSGEMARALLSSSMALTEGGGGAKE